MKSQFKKSVLSMAIALTGLTATTITQAGDIKPLHSCARTGQAAISTATRVHTATCPAGTKYYEVRVRDEGGTTTKPKLRINVTGTGGSASLPSGAGTNYDNRIVTVSGVSSDYGDSNATVSERTSHSDPQSSSSTNAALYSGYSRYTLTTVPIVPVNFTVTVTKEAGRQNNQTTAADSSGTEIYRISDHCVGDATSPYTGPFTSDLGSATSFTNYTNP